MPFNSKKKNESGAKSPDGRRNHGYQPGSQKKNNNEGRTAYSRANNQNAYEKYEYHPEKQAGNLPQNDMSEYILTGRNPIREALKNGHDLEKMLVQRGELSGSAREIVQKAKEQKVQIQIVDKIRLDAITPNHQGLIAFASAYQYSSVEDILQSAAKKNESPFLIILDGITDPHNLGAIIRTAECTGVHGIIIPQHRSVGLSPAAVKASAGAVEYVKVARVSNISKTIETLRKNGIWFYAVTMDGKDYRDVSFDGGAALVIGSEENGISRLVLEKCDYSVSLPMTGKIESLNASVAAGIMMYRVLDSRR